MSKIVGKLGTNVAKSHMVMYEFSTPTARTIVEWPTLDEGMYFGVNGVPHIEELGDSLVNKKYADYG